MNETMIMMTVPDWFLWLAAVGIAMYGVNVWLNIVVVWLKWKTRRLREQIESRKSEPWVVKPLKEHSDNDNG